MEFCKQENVLFVCLDLRSCSKVGCNKFSLDGGVIRGGGSTPLGPIWRGGDGKTPSPRSSYCENYCSQFRKFQFVKGSIAIPPS